MHSQSQSRGFTLIELLVVIAIIGILSAAILASLSGVRARGRDAAIQSELNQLANIAEMEYVETKSYAGVQASQWATTVDCLSMNFTSAAHASEVEKLCANIIKNEGGASGSLFYSGVSGSYNYVAKYSFMAYMPSSGLYECVGPSGSSIGPMDPDGAGPLVNWQGIGCFNNP